ncbi:DUF4168 domain-containing protein [Marinicauda algicola]|nr:DUF4168 domain-containing protein [Marinicauda algicola]
MKISRTLAAALAAAGLALSFGLPGIAEAQQGDAQAQTQPQVEPMSNAEMSDAQVEAFIDAATSIQAVIQEYQPRLQAAGSQEEAATLQQEAQGELVIAVEEAGLTPLEYQRIAVAAQSDPQVAQRLQAEAETRVQGE